MSVAPRHCFPVRILEHTRLRMAMPESENYLCLVLRKTKFRILENGANRSGCIDPVWFLIWFQSPVWFQYPIWFQVPLLSLFISSSDVDCSRLRSILSCLCCVLVLIYLLSRSSRSAFSNMAAEQRWRLIHDGDFTSSNMAAMSSNMSACH